MAGADIYIICAALAISLYTDLKYGKIKNYVTFPLIAYAVVSVAIRGGALYALYSFMAGFVASVMSMRSGSRGAGDIKLIIGIGTLLGPANAIFLAAFIWIYTLLSALFVRFKAHEFNLVETAKALITEVRMEVSGIPQAGFMVHGDIIKHPGIVTITLSVITLLLIERGVYYVP